MNLKKSSICKWATRPAEQKAQIKAQRESKTRLLLARITDAPDETQLDVFATAALCGIGATTVWNKVRQGLFPAPRRFGRSTRWKLGDLRMYLSGDAS